MDDAHALQRLRAGGTFILDAPTQVPAIWGEADDVLWSKGESLIIAGPTGVGKTTLAGQIVRGLLIGGQTVLGLPIKQRRRVAYLAMDRPQQIARGLRRTLGSVPRDHLNERLVAWNGPPLVDVAKYPEHLAEIAKLADADTLVVDSIKDSAVGISNDEVGAGYQRARSIAIASGIEMLELHHTTKRGPNGAAPTTLADLYGSTWITAGAGSVVLLHGDAGDPVVQFRHLKQPAGEVGPFKVEHDHAAGVSTVQGTVDVEQLAARPGGITAKDAARALFDTDTPSAAQIEKARRKLDKLTRSGAVVSVPGDKAHGVPAVWRHRTITGVFTEAS